MCGKRELINFKFDVCNFPEKNIAGIKSQVLILGSIDQEGRVTLVHPSQKAKNGLPIA